MKFWKSKEQPIPEVPMEPTKKSLIRPIALALGGLVAVSHIGLLGYVLHRPKSEVQKPPTIQIPNGPYSSYRLKATKDGYEIEYRANDPRVLESSKSLEVDRDKKGLFGGGTERRREYRTDQFTADGVRNIGGATTLDEEGKSAKTAECIAADAGARSQGAMAGTAISAGLVVPAVSSSPYVGWLAGGWALLLGQKAGSEMGSQVGSVFNDC
jgi:hypothetical protein